jgi:hypothetical protein
MLLASSPRALRLVKYVSDACASDVPFLIAAGCTAVCSVWSTSVHASAVLPVGRRQLRSKSSCGGFSKSPLFPRSSVSNFLRRHRGTLTHGNASFTDKFGGTAYSSSRGFRVALAAPMHGRVRDNQGIDGQFYVPKVDRLLQSGRYIKSCSRKTEVFWQLGHVMRSPLGGKAGLEGQCGSKTAPGGFGGISLCVK